MKPVITENQNQYLYVNYPNKLRRTQLGIINQFKHHKKNMEIESLKSNKYMKLSSSNNRH